MITLAGVACAFLGLVVAVFAGWLYRQPVPQQARWEASLVCSVMVAAGGLLISAGFILAVTAAGIRDQSQDVLAGALVFLVALALVRYIVGPLWARWTHRLDPTPLDQADGRA